MDNTFFGNTMFHITRGVIEDIALDRNNSLLTVSYTRCLNCTRRDQRIRLVVGDNTVILDENGNRIPVRDLRIGMVINATASSAMTRSIPPQSRAFMIQIVSRPLSEDITVGRIVNIDRQNRSFTTISDRNLSSIIRFQVTNDTIIRNILGRPMNFSNLSPGLRVRVRHAPFMTASIPPQTTAFEIQVIR